MVDDNDWAGDEAEAAALAREFEPGDYGEEGYRSELLRLIRRARMAPGPLVEAATRIVEAATRIVDLEAENARLRAEVKAHRGMSVLRGLTEDAFLAKLGEEEDLAWVDRDDALCHYQTAVANWALAETEAKRLRAKIEAAIAVAERDLRGVIGILCAAVEERSDG